MEMQITKQRDGMKTKLPEITKALELLTLFQTEKENDYKVRIFKKDRLSGGRPDLGQG